MSKSCKECDSAVPGIRGLCLEHRARVAEELLGVLRGILTWDQSHDGAPMPQAVWARARAAINRAEGGQS